MTTKSLLALLRSHQDGVYTVCLHVLRNSHDAEDAAQEAMLKIASGAKDLRDPRAFKSWLYRLVFRTAVDHARRRATRRRIEEGSVPMSPAPLTDEQRDAIHEAMAALPDDDRLILVEHYFEKVPIVELGRREGVSDVAMGKRIEKAREKLKRGLAGAGILLGATQVSHALESVTAATAPSGLVGSAIAAGGIAMGIKSGTAVLAVVLALGLGAGGGYLVAAKHPDQAKIRELELKLADLSQKPEATRRNADAKPASSGVTPAEPEATADGSLTAALQRYKKLVDLLNAKRKTWAAENPGKGRDAREMSRDLAQMSRELEGTRALIFADPETFLKFLADPENEAYVWHLFDVTLVPRSADTIRQQQFSDFPGPLTEGLLQLLKTGSEAVQSTILTFMRHVVGQPDEFKSQYLALLGHSQSRFIEMSIYLMGNVSPLTPGEFAQVAAVAESSPVKSVRRAVVGSMWRIQTPESKDWRLSTLEAGRMTDMDAELAMSLMMHVRDGLGDEFENRFVRSMTAALTRATGEAEYFQMLRTVPALPASKMKTLFEVAAAQGPTGKVRAAAARCLELINAGRVDWTTLGNSINDAAGKN